MSRRKFLKNVAAVSIATPLSINSLVAKHEYAKAKTELTGANVPEFTQQQLEIATRKLRDRILADSHRPVYHLVSPEGEASPFDPNGAIYWNGIYHLGYIFQDYNSDGNKVNYWGHVVSRDLFHWSILPPMLVVDNKSSEKGIFSGCAFISKDGTPHVVYHGIDAGNCIARATDESLIKWEKFPQNPVLPLKKKNALTEVSDDNQYNAWDPHIWLEGNTYYQISGGNPASLFKSNDLIDWQYVGNFMDETKRDRHAFEDWSCPDFFKIGNKYMALGISHNLGTQYYIGEFVGEQFVPDYHQRMNWHGGTFFAPETLLDHRGRRIMWGWVLDGKKYDETKGWSGTMSMPRVLELSDRGDLIISPPDEIAEMRFNKVSANSIKLQDKASKTLEGFRGDAVEIDVSISLSGASVGGVKVLCSPDGREETIIKYDNEAKEIVIDFRKSSFPGDVKFTSYCMMGYLDQSVPEFVSEQRVPFELKPGEVLILEIFVDKSILEVFANRRVCITQRIYPTLADSKGVEFFCEAGSLTFSDIRCWQISRTNFF